MVPVGGRGLAVLTLSTRPLRYATRRLLPRGRGSLQLTTQCPRFGIVGVNLPGVNGYQKTTEGLGGFCDRRAGWRSSHGSIVARWASGIADYGA
jgi:hypothetical protein